METGEILLKVVIAIMVGGLIGNERKKSGKPAGIATHMVVCMGATLLTLIQKEIDISTLELAKQYPSVIQTLKVDTARIPAQIVSGVGFLGGGVILHSKKTISGITTAATIWITACLGIGIGFGYYKIVIPFAISLLIALYILKRHGIFSEEKE
ncbi:MAG: MgtC/SapB family protein [Peptostreptococcaceae bacterium]|nr:MgtC/SapB family protein [Peptostreptococcaceae bacterium]